MSDFVPAELIDTLPSAEDIEKRVRLESDLENFGKKTTKNKRNNMILAIFGKFIGYEQQKGKSLTRLLDISNTVIIAQICGFPSPSDQIQ